MVGVAVGDGVGVCVGVGVGRTGVRVGVGVGAMVGVSHAVVAITTNKRIRATNNILLVDMGVTFTKDLD